MCVESVVCVRPHTTRRHKCEAKTKANHIMGRVCIGWVASLSMVEVTVDCLVLRARNGQFSGTHYAGFV